VTSGFFRRTASNKPRSHAPAWECLPRSGLVPMLPRGNEYAPVLECICSSVEIHTPVLLGKAKKTPPVCSDAPAGRSRCTGGVFSPFTGLDGWVLFEKIPSRRCEGRIGFIQNHPVRLRLPPLHGGEFVELFSTIKRVWIIPLRGGVARSAGVVLNKQIRLS